MKLFIKNMVSIRCKMVVKSELEGLGLHHNKIELGEAEVIEDLSCDRREKLKIALLRSGLELMDDKRSRLIEKIKNVIIEMIHYSDELPKINISNYLSEKLQYNYTYLANLFPEVEGITSEHFVIIHKVKRIKELIVYDELNLAEIANRMQYSSAAHLSHQFKKITGFAPSHFKRLKNKRRNTLEDL